MVVEQLTLPEKLQYDTNSTDEVLVAGCLEGDEVAWSNLFQRYNRLIYKVPSSFGFTYIETEEIYQEIAIEIIRCLGALEDRSRLHPWIVTIARRTCIRHLRNTAKYTTVDVQLLENEIEEGVDTLDEMLIRLEEYSLIRKALAELEPRCQTILTELFLCDYKKSHMEVAELLGMPIGSIGPTRSRCLEKLRQRVESLLSA